MRQTHVNGAATYNPAMCTVSKVTDPDLRQWIVGTPSQVACDAWCESAPDNPCAQGAGGGGNDPVLPASTDPIPPGKWLLVANYAVRDETPVTSSSASDFFEDAPEKIVARVVGADRNAPTGLGIFARAEPGQCLTQDGLDVDHSGDVKLYTVKFTSRAKDFYGYRRPWL